MRLVVGLGNPGERYRRTRHNVGFMVVDALAARWGAGRGQVEGEAWTAKADRGGETLVLAKPLTFMNRSGVAVEALLAASGQGPESLVVVLDDAALPLGQIRVRPRGGHGGHNGLRSLLDVLASDEFARVRVGIQKPAPAAAGEEGDPGQDLAEYVLSEFPQEDVLVVQEMVGTAADAVECLLEEGAEAAMNRFNARNGTSNQ
jgi:peptidyl-tRNA hydrolase, PTH1 family